MQGWRSNMEDTHICEPVDIPNGYGMLFGVFDGHGGAEVADYAKANFRKEFIKNSSFKAGDYKKALIETFLSIDKTLEKESFAMDAGCTANVVLITKDRIFCANAGDSRAILAQTGNRAVALSEDHKPNNPGELMRI